MKRKRKKRAETPQPQTLWFVQYKDGHFSRVWDVDPMECMLDLVKKYKLIVYKAKRVN